MRISDSFKSVKLFFDGLIYYKLDSLKMFDNKIFLHYVMLLTFQREHFSTVFAVVTSDVKNNKEIVKNSFEFPSMHYGYSIG